MKKVLLGLLIITLLVGCSGEEKEKIEEPKFKYPEVVDYTTFVKEGATYDKVIETDIEINGYKHRVGFVYSYDMEFLDEGDMCNNCIVRNYYMALVFDGNVVKETGIGMYEEKDEIKVEYIELENLKTIKDTDSNVEYISIYFMNQSNYKYLNYNLVIIDENGKILYEDTQEASFKVIYNNKEVQYIEFHDKYIYVLKHENCEKAHKEKVTVKNGIVLTENITIGQDIKITGNC